MARLLTGGLGKCVFKFRQDFQNDPLLAGQFVLKSRVSSNKVHTPKRVKRKTRSFAPQKDSV
ncbi:MAG: hypothetical protein ACLTVB_08345, partial [Sutterella sp.]